MAAYPAGLAVIIGFIDENGFETPVSAENPLPIANGIPAVPATGSYTLQSVDGELTWVAN